MAALRPSRTSQNVMNAEFAWSIGDTMTNVAGTADEFASAAAHVFDAINLPPGAIIISGQLVVTTAFDGTTYPVVIGDSAVANRYLATADRKAAAITALVPTGYVGLGENLRVTITPTGTTTAGTGYIHIQYVIQGRSNEVVSS